MMCRFASGRMFAGWMILAITLLLPVAAWAGACLECHASPDLKVRSPRLMSCYQAWRDSPHAQAKVGCADCHGGADSTGTHGQCPSVAGGMISDFRRVPQTCGRCHGDVLAAYRDSRHFARLQEGVAGVDGPNCVTCHGSMGASRVETLQVVTLCASCHDGARAPDQGIPRRARAVLDDMLSIRQFSAWLGLHEQDPGFEKRERVRQIQLWHHFDLPSLEEQSAKRLDELKARVHDLRARETEAKRKRRQ